MILATSHMTSAGGRARNEDAVAVVHGDGFSLLALADGFGGHRGGGPAARCCVEAVTAAFARAPDLSKSGLQAIVDEATRAIEALRREMQASASSMRTTLAMLAVIGDQARWVHVGDSRVYWYRDGHIMDRTRDHSVAALIAGLPDEFLAAATDASDRHRLFRAVGAAETCRAEVSEPVIDLQPGDAFLLCSDGMWNLIADDKITAALRAAASPSEWRNALEEHLSNALCRKPTEQHDDVSMIAGMVMP
jgi:PPM family protein phosphatase